MQRISVPLEKVELNITELCNRTCSFCPRSVDYPNQDFHMSLNVAYEALRQTSRYTNFISITGRGEPLLAHNFLDILEMCVKMGKHVRITTNGDKLDSMFDDIHSLVNLKKPYESLYHKLRINSYDSEDQHNDRLKKWGMYKGIKFINQQSSEISYSNHDKIFGGKLTNRGGFFPWASQSFLDDPCFYLYGRTIINWNGDVNLCCMNWKNIKRFGNILQQDFQKIWEGEEMVRWRSVLSKPNGRARFDTCAECDAKPIDDEEKHYKMWKLNQIQPYKFK